MLLSVIISIEQPKQFFFKENTTSVWHCFCKKSIDQVFNLLSPYVVTFVLWQDIMNRHTTVLHRAFIEDLFTVGSKVKTTCFQLSQGFTF